TPEAWSLKIGFMKYLLFFLLPKSLLSQVIGRLSRLEAPLGLVEWAKSWFIARYKLNMEEAEKTVAEYPSLNALFTRRLKPGVRPIESDVVHPCDAVISQTGP